ncbi:MAG: M20/M25/M40 family metallo-hydrolase [Gemmatimonadaceae bacterium]|nr:M20/M25/M40 family metallo-hydrolase [Gemmatimonadaceae bacterium]
MAAAIALAFVPAAVLAQEGNLPLKYKAQPTRAAITAGDLMSRLYIFADDSMMGREFGTEGNLKATAYIAKEMKRLGLKPAGDDGYYQWVPTALVSFNPASQMMIGSRALVAGKDFVASNPRGGVPRSFDSLQVVYGGDLSDTTNLLNSATTSGKAVVLMMRGSTQTTRRLVGRYNNAAAVITVGQPRSRRSYSITDPNAPQVPASITVSPAVVGQLFKLPAGQMTPPPVGSTGQTLYFQSFGLTRDPARARNIVAILRGSDPKLRREYVAIGAHNDHLGFGAPVDHDSLRTWNVLANRIVEARTHQTPGGPGGGLTVEERASIHVNVDSLHRLRPARMDSVYNGADDDGSGSVGVLEIAEAFAKAKVRPKRSIIFVFHTGEEAGLLGSQWFTDHPTVPRDSIVAQLNVDMIGRGDAFDYASKSANGSESYLQLVGSRRLSTELGDLIESVNKTERYPMTFDYAIDANGHPERIYCRSDHANYARYGIPVTFFTTGLHMDYHQLTDEPQYIDYTHMAHVTELVYDVAGRVANLDHRVALDRPKPTDSRAACVQ